MMRSRLRSASRRNGRAGGDGVTNVAVPGDTTVPGDAPEVGPTRPLKLVGVPFESTERPGGGLAPDMTPL
jgi:hypothetical protein